MNITAENTNKLVERVITRLSEIKADDTGMWDGLAVNAATLLYKKTQDEALKAALLKKVDEFVAGVKVMDIEELEFTTAPCLLYTAFKLTGDEKYKNKAMELERSDEKMGFAFDMMHETAFGGKEHYHAITVAFNELAKKEPCCDTAKAMFMEALIDTIEAIDQPVYELYRSLVDLFRAQLKGLIANGEVALIDEKAKMILAYAIKKACDMKVILAEKYEAVADKISDNYETLDCAYVINYAQHM